MFGLTILFFVNYESFNGSVDGKGFYDQYGVVNQIILIPIYIATFLSIYSASIYLYLNYHYFLNDKINNKKTIK